MTAATLAHQSLNVPAFWRRIAQSNRFLVGNALIASGLFLVTLLLLPLDSREVTGALVWLKPMKFAISTILYCLTLAWMLTYVQGRRRLVSLIAIVTAIALFVELAIISLQAARGVRSHFNIGTELDAALFSIMGGFVILIWIMNLLAAWLLLRQRLPDAAFAWSLRLGLLITAVGAGTGYLMVRPTPAQVAAMEAGESPTFVGAHTVGVPDGGAGLPVTGWSTEGGDLRVAHFAGLHALQLLPLLGLFVGRSFAHTLSMRRRTLLVWTGGLGYLGLVLLLVWQALRGQPLLAPDATTLTALGALVATVGLVTGLVVASPRRRI